ncbi:MAG: class I SAM-dependent methyltransferase [Candidatus Nanoarchaeia archaeon]|nr:class I SAM-dependent methyltransferase [Candidatus Nanoarchaeia archaeon]
MKENIYRKELLELGNLRNKKILDVGVGELAIIAARDFDCDVTTIDLTKEKLDSQRYDVINNKLEGKIKLEIGDATKLKYKDKSFDASVSYGALHHVSLNKRNNFISELCRVSREKVVIAEFTEKGFPHKDEYETVDLEWLGNELEKYGKVEKHESIKKNIYICFKD